MSDEADQKPELPVEAPQEPDRVLLHMPVDVRSASLVVLAVLATVFALRWAAAVFIPLMVSLMLTYALAPLVDQLERWRISRWIGAAVILLGLGGAFGWTGYSLSGSASELLDALPVAAQKLRIAMRTNSRATDANALDTVQKAAAQLEQAAEENSAKVAARKGVARVVIERPSSTCATTYGAAPWALISAAGQLTLVAFLTFFALGSGDTFRRKLVKITGPSLQKRRSPCTRWTTSRSTSNAICSCRSSPARWSGVATGLAFWAIGLENAAVWASWRRSPI